MSDVIIRAVKDEDFDQWLRLYHGYADHYKVSLTQAIITNTCLLYTSPSPRDS